MQANIQSTWNLLYYLDIHKREKGFLDEEVTLVIPTIVLA